MSAPRQNRSIPSFALIQLRALGVLSLAGALMMLIASMSRESFPMLLSTLAWLTSGGLWYYLSSWDREVPAGEYLKAYVPKWMGLIAISFIVFILGMFALAL